MILVLGGTTEGSEIANRLTNEGYQVLVSTATKYGLKCSEEQLKIITGRLTCRKMESVIRKNGIRLVVDATHPFATQVSENAKKACRKTGTGYIYFERNSLKLPQNKLIHRVKSFEGAAQVAANLGDNIFLTTGSKTLEVFIKVAQKKGRRIIARVLPEPTAIQKCFDLGLKPDQIVAAKGPFSKAFNKAWFEEYKASVVVTKESGQSGGTLEKIQAALELNIPLVVISRSYQGEGMTSPKEVIASVKTKLRSRVAIENTSPQTE
jgi:precorrin-6A/cobalt-precorrin-6A reductase